MLVLRWWNVAWLCPIWPGMLVRGPEVMDMGSKGVVPLEFSWLVWWIVALLGSRGQECMSWQRKGSGYGCAVPGVGWDGLDKLDKHFESVDMDAPRVGACVHKEVVELCPEMACAVVAGE